ncbi:hypothetical protein BU23DRAFT_455456 [Bimuria novae-zelandiae CBS 107.79]|uniref:Pentatricopeptide repeat-containing protein-mitochondrial domain-containing protein n=1 Tax=Bimuria novae-zelandiae CBS 107.79 TaxID=1447943 RepID=A0A6A5VLR0_9PLEO|nr:hypothetical protein BU23DRAFT_455456 [Bimuria novae-zelandiae CBS 107.79]
MPPRPFVNDALWQCLCPRWTQVAARTDSRLIGAASAIRSSTPKRFPHGSTSSAVPKQPCHAYNTAANAPKTRPESIGAFDSFRGGLSDSRGAPNESYFEQNVAPDGYARRSSDELYAYLRVAATKELHSDVMKMLRVLIMEKRERPNLAMYTALLHSYASPQWGSAGKIRKALEDMAIAGIELDARACECTLEALAVHPDSFTRTDILEYMRERWWTPTPRAQSFVVAGMLRERCFEMALEKLESMIKEGVRIEPWLWDKALWMLLEFGEVEEAFHVLNLKRNVVANADASVSGSLWTQLLDVAGKRHIAEAASMIWHTQVVPGYIKPTTGTCLNVLSVASRVGDVKLATDVFRILAERNTVFINHHYEALIHCYLVANDLPAALSVILIMQDASLKITEDELHPLYGYLCKDKDRPMNAFMQLQDLERSGRTVPTAAVNICIKASITLGNLPEGIELYKALKSVAKAGPTTATFNELFRGCNLNSRKELAMYLASEMIQLDIRPDRITYDRLILTCCMAGDLDDALAYFEEMMAEGLAPRRRTHERLIEDTVKARDGRCVALLKQYKEAEYRVDARAVYLERQVLQHFEEGGAAKKDVKDESQEEALDALQREWELKMDQESKTEETPQKDVATVSEGISTEQSESGGQNAEGSEKRAAVDRTEEQSTALSGESETQLQPQSKVDSVPNYTKFHV